ncbi:mesenchyme-specific cell surface glycoprotein-like isoform X2 [Biomphalaria glabrata]|nr:mesenchyme-specific cell surface glycoprotein-like isoform X2 [Biomphalaria glabrata]
MAIHEEDKTMYVVGKGLFHVVNISDPTNLVYITTVPVLDSDLTDVEVCGNYIFITSDNMKDKANGQLLIYSRYTTTPGFSLRQINAITVGAQPDMLQLTKDCQTAVIAVEGEPVETGEDFTDYPGAIAIVRFEGGRPADSIPPEVKILDFKKFETSYDDLLARNVKMSYSRTRKGFSDEFEPEYITIDEESRKAYVVLQENNAVVEVDLNTYEITQIYGLGYKQWGHLDASKSDGGISISYWPIRSFYQPDAIKFYVWQQRKLAFTANEGEYRVYPNDGFDERRIGVSFKGSKFGPNVPLFVVDALNDSRKLGDLTFSKGDGFIDGTYEALYMFGGRSFSIWDTENNFELLYDSGSDFEEKIAVYCPHVFNSNGDVIDTVSDQMGVQPEGLATLEMDSRLFIFITIENPGMLLVYSLDADVTSPRFETIFCDGIPKDSRSLTAKYMARELYMVHPEDIRILGEGNTISKSPLVFVTGSVSGTVSVLKVGLVENAIKFDESRNHSSGTAFSSLSLSLAIWCKVIFCWLF